MMLRRFVAIPLTTLAVLALAQLPNAAASPKETAEAMLTVAAPEGVPATISLDGRREDGVAAKPAAGTEFTSKKTLQLGTYGVDVEPFTFEGQLYMGRPSKPHLHVHRGQNKPISVTYEAVPAARDFHTTTITQTSIGLTWTPPAGSTVVLRKAQGDEAPATMTDGLPVATQGAEATDAGLTAGQRYSYSLFTNTAGTWYGPMRLTVGTAPPAGSNDATFVAAPTTTLATVQDVVSFGPAPGGEGVTVMLADGVLPSPILGAAVVLPVLPDLPGGYLGVITDIADDGTLTLRAGALDDAFDFYDLKVTQLPPMTYTPAPPTPDAEIAEQRATQEARERSPHDQGLQAAALPDCFKVSGTKKITLKPSFTNTGHFETKIDKYKVLGVSIPKGASLDMEFGITAKLAADVKTTGSFACSANLGKFEGNFSAGPVPMGIQLAAKADVNLTGTLDMKNLGFTTTVGFQLKGHMGIDNGAGFSGSPFLTVAPLTPQVTASGTVGVKLGGGFVVGPGSVNSKLKYGFIAGLSGELNLLDASAGPVFPIGDPRYNACLTAKAAASAGIGLTAKAWLGKWSGTKTFTIPALNWSKNYPGSPWYFPSGCQSAVEPTPSPDVLGDGVTKDEDSVDGAETQWGRLDGFAPGQKTWVLSNGNIAAAVGEPAELASADLQRAGDSSLDALAGHPTYDAAAYTVKLIPAGNRLHVRYAFATEEFPDYVDSEFNDVMAVFVAGKNCALVPGTTEPVSVNTVNLKTNSQYFVDNRNGAAGYSTTMNGLTKPLTCTVPVTPGVPVTIKVAVADSADHVLDSAVALLDNGIWSD